MKLFVTRQIAEIDRFTIENEPVADIDLMERAARNMFTEVKAQIAAGSKLIFFAGPGNNGGDALALSRMFADAGFDVSAFIFSAGKPLSPSCDKNLQRLKNQSAVEIKTISGEAGFPVIPSDAIVFDGLFGSGLTRPLQGAAAALVNHINRSGAKIIAIDIPSGLMGEENPANAENAVVRAELTLTLQFPKISFLFPENESYVGNVKIIDIGLHPEAIAQTPTPFFMIDKTMVKNRLPVRKKFSHKGTFGHALLIAGSYGKMGAAALASMACVRAGAGLLTVHVPAEGVPVLQTSVPEAMCSIDENREIFSVPPDLENYNAIGAGPGIGTHGQTQEAFRKLLESAKTPMVIDADALNIVAANREWLNLIPPGSILTPHPGEFRRLFGDFDNAWQRILFLQEISHKYKIVVVLKGAYTAVVTPARQVFFNPTGNAGMATGGSGDVLTGIILGLLAQKLPPEDAAIAGVYLHGLAGDLAVRKISMPALTASDLCRFLGKAFLKVGNYSQG